MVAPESRASSSIWGTAEQFVRRLVIYASAGICSSLLSRFAFAHFIAPSIGRQWRPEAELERLFFDVCIVRFGLWLFIPAVGLIAGRVFAASPGGFSVAAVMGGELFDVTLYSALDGLDWVFPSEWSLAFRLGWDVLAIVLAAGAVRFGRGAMIRAQAAAQHVSEQHQRRHEAYARAAEARGNSGQSGSPPRAD
jgi:hypothetical protein